MNFRRLRSFGETLNDPNFVYQVGKLIGAAEMASHWLKLREDEEAKAVGLALEQQVNWFFMNSAQDMKQLSPETKR